eukprot:scaffold128317_cov53-Attheya_sp.AAC.1
MSTPPSADTVDTVPSITKGALTHITHDPNVAYRPSKPTTLATAVASLVPTLVVTRLRPAPSVTNHAVPATLQDAMTPHTPPDPTVALDQPLATRSNRYRPSKPTSTTTAVASL